MQDAYSFGGDQWRLLRGLCHHGVAGDQCRRHLTEEDRQWKIPRTDADEHAATTAAQLIAFAGRTRHRLKHQRMARLRRIVAAEIDRLAMLGHRVVERLAALALHQRDETATLLFQEIARALELRCTLLDRRRLP